MMLYEDKKATWEYCHTRQAEEAVTRGSFSILAKVHMGKNSNLQLRQKNTVGYKAELLQLNRTQFPSHSLGIFVIKKLEILPFELLLAMREKN